MQHITLMYFSYNLVAHILGYAIIKNKSGSTLIIQDNISLNNESKMKLELDGCSHGFVTIRTPDNIPIATNVVVKKGNKLIITKEYLDTAVRVFKSS